MDILTQTIDIETEDGYAGTLAIDISTIKTEIASYGSTRSSVSTTRTYTDLPCTDTSNIPETVQENGLTYNNFTDVCWSGEYTCIKFRGRHLQQRR